MLNSLLKISFSLLIGLLICQPAQCRSESHTQWYQCQTAAECVVGHGNCGVEWAVNKKFANLSRRNPPKSVDDCTKPEESHPADTFAICVEGKCLLYPSGQYAGGKSIDPDQCVISSCWGHMGCNYLTCTHTDGSAYTKYAQ